MFDKRHEQELAEIKALTHDLTRRFEEIVKELRSIHEAQEELLARDRERVTGKRDAGDEPEAAGEAFSETAPGGKRARRRQSAAPVAAAPRSKSRKRRDSDGSGAGKRGGGARRKKRQPPQAVARSSADEE